MKKYMYPVVLTIAGTTGLLSLYGQGAGDQRPLQQHNQVNGQQLPQQLEQVESILKFWHSYFQSFDSLTYTAEMAPWNKNGDLGKVQISFSSQQQKYRTELLYPISTEYSFSQLISAFDGMSHQLLTIDRKSNDKQLILSGGPFKEDPVPGATPFGVLFKFAFPADSNMGYRSLGNVLIWKRLEPRIVKIEQVKDERTGLTLTIQHNPDVRTSQQRYEVFVEKATGLPKSWKVISRKPNKILSELQVLEEKEIKLGKTGTRAAFPIKVEFKTYDEEAGSKPTSGFRWKIDPASLRVNLPVKDTDFTIPIEQDMSVLSQ